MEAATADSETQTQELSDLERAILDVERAWWKYAGAKEGHIRTELDMSPTRFYQVLNALLDSPAAMIADPMLIKRLRRLREIRREQRSVMRAHVHI